MDDVAQQLSDWADDIEQADLPDLPDPDLICEECGGECLVDNTEYDWSEALSDDNPEEVECPSCEGDGLAIPTPDEPTETQMDDWRTEVARFVALVDESPFLVE